MIKYSNFIDRCEMICVKDSVLIVAYKEVNKFLCHVIFVKMLT